MNFHKFTYDGRERTIRQKSDTASWFIREKIDGKLISTRLNTHNRKDAERKARDFLKEKSKGQGQPLRILLRQRETKNPTPVTGSSLGDIIEAYKTAPQGPLERTRRENITCLRNIIHQVYGPVPIWSDRPLSDLTRDVVRNYRRLVVDRARKLSASAAETARHQRTANSTLRQARSIFSTEMIEYYQLNCGFLFDNARLNEFRTTPGFVGLRKTIYQQPDDQQLAAMIDALEEVRHKEPDLYLICWLGLTFGLRKSEVAPLTTDCFVRVNGEVYVEIRMVEGRGVVRDRTKNGQETPRIKATNGGWAKIGPIIEAMPKGRYVIAGSDTERTDRVFRRINAWMASLGWKTQKKFHELRALAGSRVIMNDGIEAASQWLRHGSISTTQSHYGRYARTSVRDIPLSFEGQKATPESGGERLTNLGVTAGTPLGTPNCPTDRVSNCQSNWYSRAETGAGSPAQSSMDKSLTEGKQLI
jgi:integrase